MFFFFRKCKQRRFIKSVKQCNKHNKNFHEGLSHYSQTVNFFTTKVNTLQRFVRTSKHDYGGGGATVGGRLERFGFWLLLAMNE